MARPRVGRIFTRTRGGCYYVQFYANGKQIVRALHNEQGDPITDVRKARQAADVLVRPYNLADDTAVRRSAYNALRNAQDAARDAQEEADAVRIAEEKRRAQEKAAREAEEAHRSRLRLAGAWQCYLDNVNRPQSGEATLRQYGFQWQAFTRWLATNRPEAVALADVTPADAEAYIGALAGALANGTVNKHRALLELVFRILGEKEPLPHGNPFATIRRRKETQEHRQELRPETLWRVFEAAEGEWKRLLFVGLYTGQRLADCCLLGWEQVDLRVGGEGWITFMPRKTRRVDTTVEVPVVDHLRNELEHTPPAARTGYVMPTVAALYVANRDRVTDRIQALFRRCGVEVYEKNTGPKTGRRAVLRYGFHSLRHSTATLLQEMGAPAAVAEAILGHRSQAMRQRYTHVGRQALASAMTRMPAIEDPAKRKALAQGSGEAAPRDRFRSLADTLPIATIERILADIEKGGVK